MIDRRPTLYTLAGFDPSGGAGALLDVRLFERLGFRGVAVLTALTAQNSRRVDAVLDLPPHWVRRQYRLLLADAPPAGIKVGMVGSEANLVLVRKILRRHKGIPRVVDPVLRSSSGLSLYADGAGRKVLELLRRAATLITPNLPEAEVLSGREVRDRTAMEDAAKAIFDASGVPCLVKGGHLADGAVDVLYDGQRFSRFEHTRLKRDVHGTGCFYSSAALAWLARGLSLEDACRRASELTHRAIRSSRRPGPEGRHLPALPPSPKRRRP